ncbi:MAG: hypothetical protein NDP22_03675, partial [Crenarchaeota archaeon]|nr:hypothetical protein [Thermoproteota archaeon]
MLEQFSEEKTSGAAKSEWVLIARLRMNIWNFRELLVVIENYLKYLLKSELIEISSSKSAVIVSVNGMNVLQLLLEKDPFGELISILSFRSLRRDAFLAVLNFFKILSVFS